MDLWHARVRRLSRAEIKTKATELHLLCALAAHVYVLDVITTASGEAEERERAPVIAGCRRLSRHVGNACRTATAVCIDANPDSWQTIRQLSEIYQHANVAANLIISPWACSTVKFRDFPFLTISNNRIGYFKFSVTSGHPVRLLDEYM
jgi:hypothetical protein